MIKIIKDFTLSNKKIKWHQRQGIHVFGLKDVNILFKN